MELPVAPMPSVTSNAAVHPGPEDVPAESAAAKARDALRVLRPDTSEAQLALAEALGTHAPALLPLVLADPSVLDDVQARPLDRTDDRDEIRKQFAVCAEANDEATLHRLLRQTRHRAMVRIALREVLRYADIDQTASELAVVGSAALDAALSACRHQLVQRFGDALHSSDPNVPIAVSALGMGKLGGGELNFGSDVDLIFFYDTDDGQVGDGLEVTVHDFFTRLVRLATKALSQVTEHGFVFRVDLRLRPEGSQGPLANSLASAERYYTTFGRTWERGALLRGRPVAGDPAFGEVVVDALRPFVFQRSVDPSIAAEMHGLTRRSRRDLAVDDARNVKLGRGGIREAEFFVQSLQLIWGGRHPELQVAGTMEGLRRLRSLGLVTHSDAEQLETSWALLRRVEHRIHMVAGYQTHDLPEPRGLFAASLGFDDSEALDDALSSAREIVKDLYDSLLEDTDEQTDDPDLGRLIDRLFDGDAARLAEMAERLFAQDDVDEVVAHLTRLARWTRSPFGPVGRQSHPQLARVLLREVLDAADPVMALSHLADFFLRGGSGFARSLEAEPRLTRRLIGLFGSSPTLAELLVGHPETLGELLAGASLPSAEQVARAHDDGAVQRADIEDFVAWLRRLRREHLLRVGLAQIGGELDERGSQLALSALADAQVRASLHYAARETIAKLGQPDATCDGFVVVGMGKLGGGELGFTSDLDLIFLYEGDGETANGRSHVELFSRIAQRTMRLLSQADAEGPGYEVDARLRPSGAQGLLVTSIDSFERYHQTRAQPWERQALVRARPVAATIGADEMAGRVARLLEETAYGQGEPEVGRLVALRARMQRELAGERPDRYHPKLGFGGLVDIEFLVQWLQMRHGSEPSVRRRHTTGAIEALRRLAERGSKEPGLTDHEAEALLDAYAFFRRVEQAAGLLDPASGGALRLDGPRGRVVARALDFRERDGVPPVDVLRAFWQRRATEVRTLFEARLAPVGEPPPWRES